MKTNIDNLHMQDCLGDGGDTAFTVRTECWNSFHDHSAHSCYRADRNKESSLLRCRQEVDYELQFVEFLESITEPTESFDE